jgi:hypothetical protein
MSTTFAVILKNGEQHDVARRVGRGILGCELYFTNEMTELMSDETPVIPTDNSAQGIFTIGDIREHIRKQEEAERETEEEGLVEGSWIDDPSKIEYYQRKSVFAPMTDGWHKDHDFIEVTEWKNGEGWDIEIAASPNSKHVSIHFTEFAVIKELIALLEKN